MRELFFFESIIDFKFNHTLGEINLYVINIILTQYLHLSQGFWGLNLCYQIWMNKITNQIFSEIELIYKMYNLDLSCKLINNRNYYINIKFATIFILYIK